MRNENTPTLQTERLILRKFNEGDAQALLEILSEEETNRFLPWFPVKSLAEAQTFLQERFLVCYDKPAAYCYAVCLKEDNQPIGYVWLSDNESNDFGYGLQQAYWHKGIATEAAQAVLGRIREAGYPYITATHDVNNPHSGQVMQKLGMTYRYSYVEQWQPKDIAVTFRMYQLNLDKNQEQTYLEYWNRYDNHFAEEL